MFYLLGLILLLTTPVDDYFEQITVASDGRITRFERMPITVYIQPAPDNTANYETIVLNAATKWEQASEELVRFTPSQNGQTADVRVFWSNNPPRFQDPSQVAKATLVRTDDHSFYVDIQVNLHQWPSLKRWKVEDLQRAILHELGHALGLWGHSPRSADVMCRASDSEWPTARDVATLKLLYNTPIGSARHQEALSSLRAELRAFPTDANLHYLLGTVLIDLGDYAQAIVALQKALELDPSVATYAARLGMVYQQQGKMPEAIRHYEKAVSQNPTSALYGMLGALHLFSGSFEQAVASYRQAIRMDRTAAALKQNLLAVYHRWALSLLKNDQYADASRVLDEGLQLYEQSSILNYDRGVAFEGSEDYEHAIQQYDKSLSLNSELRAARLGLASAWNNLGSQHVRAQRWQDAIRCYETSLKWDPDCWEASRNLDMVYLQQAWHEHAAGNLGVAIAKYERVLAHDPENAEAHHNLGLVYLRQGRYPESIGCLRRALALAPDSDEIRDNLRYAQREQWMVYLRGVFLPVVALLLASFFALKWTYRRIGRLHK